MLKLQKSPPPGNWNRPQIS